jgi:hypothetical protein
MPEPLRVSYAMTRRDVRRTFTGAHRGWADLEVGILIAAWFVGGFGSNAFFLGAAVGASLLILLRWTSILRQYRRVVAGPLPRVAWTIGTNRVECATDFGTLVVTPRGLSRVQRVADGLEVRDHRGRIIGIIPTGAFRDEAQLEQARSTLEQFRHSDAIESGTSRAVARDDLP